MHEVTKNERRSNLTEHLQGLKGNLSTTFCDQFIFHYLDNEQASSLIMWEYDINIIEN